VADRCIGAKLFVPCQTRWNSKHDALRQLVQLQDKVGQICDAVGTPRNLVYCMSLVSSLLCGLNTRFSSMFNYDLSVPEAKDAILAAVSHPVHILKWLPPDNRDEVSQAFVEAVAMIVNVNNDFDCDLKSF